MMDLLDTPRQFPQFGKHLTSLARPRSEVFKGKGKGKGSCGCGGGKGSCGCSEGKSSCGCGGGKRACGCRGGTRPEDDLLWTDGSPYQYPLLGHPDILNTQPQSRRRERTKEGARTRAWGDGQKTCKELCPRQEALRQKFCEHLDTFDFYECIRASQALERCCKTECHRPGQERRTDDPGSCNYGDATICCEFLNPLALIRAFQGWPPRRLPAVTCKCCWKLNCVCCRTGDSHPGLRCVRACLYCRTGGVSPWGRAGDTRVHEECLASCKAQGLWRIDDETAFLEAVDTCVSCNDPSCEDAMMLGAMFRDTPAAALAQCSYSDFTHGNPEAEAAPGAPPGCK